MLSVCIRVIVRGPIQVLVVRRRRRAGRGGRGRGSRACKELTLNVCCGASAQRRSGRGAGAHRGLLRQPNMLLDNTMLLLHTAASLHIMRKFEDLAHSSCLNLYNEHSCDSA